MSDFTDKLDKIAESTETEKRVKLQAKEEFHKAWHALKHNYLLPTMEEVTETYAGFVILCRGENFEPVEFGAQKRQSDGFHKLEFLPNFDEEIITVTSAFTRPRSMRFTVSQLSKQSIEDKITEFFRVASRI